MIKTIVSVVLITLCVSGVARANDYSQLGWPQTLTDLYQQLDAKPKNFFILISRFPSIPVDFRSNEGMHNSINSLSFQKNFHPGHKMIGWKCRIGGAPFETMLGLSGESSDQHKDLLDDGWGLSALLATFKDGFIQTPDEIENRFKFFTEENEKSAAAGQKKKIFLMATVIEISEIDCENLVNESFNFLDHPLNPTENFSMILSPALYEGAGCGTFAAHFMDQLEGFSTLTTQFRRQLNLPNYLFGTGKTLSEDVEIPEKIKRVALPHPVSKLKLISSMWNSTASPNVSVEILDPELVVFWQKLFFENYFEQNDWTKQKKSFNKLVERGIWQRSEDIYNSGNSSNAYVLIDQNYDERTKAIKRLHSKFVENANLTYFTFSNFPGIILEKK